MLLDGRASDTHNLSPRKPFGARFFMTYADTIYGQDQPEEMWLTGEAAMLLLEKLNRPLLDANGQPIDPQGSYYLSKETGLVCR